MSEAPSAEEISVSAREHPDIHRDTLIYAIGLARDRGGQTIPVSGYDITRAEDAMSGYADENAKLRAKVAELEAAIRTIANGGTAA